MSKELPYSAPENDPTSLISEFIAHCHDQSYSNEDCVSFQKAWDFLCKKCEGQKRKCGAPYYLHPLRVSYVLLQNNFDAACIVAGMLHCVHNIGISDADIEHDFGSEVATLVEGVQKLQSLDASSKTISQADAIRKMLFALSKDVRVIFVKIADRLDRIRNIKSLEKAEQRALATEIIDIWAPLADRLGMQQIKNEFEDLSLKYTNSDAFQQIKSVVSLKKAERADYLDHAVSVLRNETLKQNLFVTITSRAKHFYSIYQKMRKRNKDASELFDLFALRVICNTDADCYTILGIVHNLWKPLDGRFKDYIAFPKGNGYQSLHTTVMCDGQPLEVQIRTQKMHDIAEHGVASHWLYKAGTNHDLVDAKNLDIFNEAQKIRDADASTFENYKNELLKDEIFVFTPKGQVKKLPQGANAIDFAYAIHSDIGQKIIGAKADGKIISLTTPLRNTQIVEILTHPNAHPTVAQLVAVKTSKAHQKIHSWLSQNDPNFTDTATEKLRAPKDDSTPQQNQPLDGRRPSHKHGTAKTSPKDATTDAQSHSVLVDGLDNIEINFAKCCNPRYPDIIAGYMSRLRGVVVHRADCLTYLRIPNVANRKVGVQWS